VRSHSFVRKRRKNRKEKETEAVNVENKKESVLSAELKAKPARKTKFDGGLWEKKEGRSKDQACRSGAKEEKAEQPREAGGAR